MSANAKREGGFREENSSENREYNSLSGHNTVGGRFKGVFLLKGPKRDQYRFKKMAPFSIPEIKRCPGKWYIMYRYLIPPELAHLYPKQKTKRFKVYEEINSQPPGRQEGYACELREAVEIALREGYNPFLFLVKDTLQFQVAEVEKSVKEAGLPIVDVLEAYLKHKEHQGCRSMGSFRTTINHFKNWLEDKKWLNRGVKEFSEDDMKEFLETYRDQECWSPTTWNCNRNYVFNWFKFFKKQQFIDQNPLTDRIELAKRGQVTKNEDYQGVVKKIVLKYLENDPVLSRLCRGVYYTCARSYKEFCFIKVWHVDRKGRLIKVPLGKTGYRHIPLCDELEDMLFNEMKIDQFPHEYYVFGPEALPNVKFADKNHFSRKYRVMKDSLGLGANYSIYGWKHTRVCDLMETGLYKPEEVMELTGHTDYKSFEKYTRGLGRRITNKLKGATISFYTQ